MNIKKINNITLVPRPGIEPQPLPWKGRVFTTGQTGTSPFHLCWQYLWSTPAPQRPQSCPEAHTYFAQFYFFSTDFFEEKGREKEGS